eukprot:3451808-Pyramimonas_sp.AAC.1
MFQETRRHSDGMLLTSRVCTALTEERVRKSRKFVADRRSLAPGGGFWSLRVEAFGHSGWRLLVTPAEAGGTS